MLYDPTLPHFRLSAKTQQPVPCNAAAEALADDFHHYLHSSPCDKSAVTDALSFCGAVILAGKTFAMLAQQPATDVFDIYLVPSRQQPAETGGPINISFFQRVLDNLPSEIAVFDEQFRYRYVNRSAVRNEEIRSWLIGKTDYEYCVYRNRELSIAESRTRSFRQAWDSQQELEWEEEQKQPDGSLKYFLRRVSPITDEQGRTVLLIGYGMDITDLKKARIKLLISEERYRHLVEESSDILYTTDVDGNFTYINKVAEKITGFSLEEILGKPYLHFIRPDYTEKAYDFYIRQRDRQEENSYFEFPMLTRDGKEIWVGQKVRMLYDESGFLGVLAIARDITDLKRAEHQLLAMITSLDDIVMEIDEEFRFLNIWTANEKELFHPVKDVLGKPMRELYGEEFSKPFEDLAQQVIADGVSRTIEYKHPYRDQWYSAKMNLLSYAELHEKRVSLLIRNITEIRNAQEKLLHSQENLTALIENTSDIVYSIDTSYRLLSFNSRFAGIERELSGWEPAVGHALPLDTMETYRRKEWEHIYSEVFNGHSSHVEVILSLGKRNYVFEYSLSPIRTQDGQITGAAVFGRDITIRKKAEKQILRAQKLAMQSNKSREQFIASMSHELRTPIHTILGSSHLLNSGNPDAAQRECISAIRESSRFLLSMINDILDFSKIDSGKIVMESVAFSFGELKNAILLNFGESAKEKGVQLNIHADEEFLQQHFTGDPNKIRQVLVNLTGNALKFTSYGSIDIFLQRRNVDAHSAAITITVKDTGIGMTAAQMKRIFKPFGQGSDQISKKYGGSGLGLIISKKIMQALHGTITVESEPGKGSSFRAQLQLPFAEEIPAAIAPAPIVPETKPTLLLVEDHDFNRYFMKQILLQKGFTVFEAGNGKKALEMLREHPQIELVLLDLRMPGWDGYTTNQKIQQQYGAKLPVVALTAYTLKEEQEKCRAEGFAGFIVKPVDPDKLETIIYETLNISSDATVAAQEQLYSLDSLKDIFGTDETVHEIVQIFLKSANESREELSRMLNRNDYSQLSGLLHRLRPTATLMNMKKLEQVALANEKGKEFTEAEGHKIAQLVREELEKISRQLQQDLVTAN